MPLALIEELKSAGRPDRGALNRGRRISTDNGVIVIGATNGALFGAFMTKTGEPLGHAELDATAHGAPIRYLDL